MKREYFCGGCGLFHWVDQYSTDSETGKIEYLRYPGCPNKECVSHQEPDIAIFACDTTGWAYFVEANHELIDQIKWSSPDYAPPPAIDWYENHGVRIENAQSAIETTEPPSEAAAG